MRTQHLLGLLRLFRFELPFSAGVCVVIGELLALGTIPTTEMLSLGFFSIFFISATALILNDYFDLEADIINAPERPLPSGLVTKNEVLALSVLVALLGFAASFMISGTALAVSVVVWSVGFLYNYRLKRTGIWGNLLVAFSVGMTFVFGGIAAGKPMEPIVLYFGGIAFLIDLGEEIAADAMDVEGDRVAGSRSLALTLSPESALKVSSAIFLAVVVLDLLPMALGWMEWYYAVPMLLMNLVIVVSSYKLHDAHSPNRRAYIRWIYLSALAALLLFLAIRMLA